MDDQCNTGGTTYRDKDGKVISEEEFIALSQNPQTADAQDTASAQSKRGGKKQ